MVKISVISFSSYSSCHWSIRSRSCSRKREQNRTGTSAIFGWSRHLRIRPLEILLRDARTQCNSVWSHVLFCYLFIYYCYLLISPLRKPVMLKSNCLNNTHWRKNNSLKYNKSTTERTTMEYLGLSAMSLIGNVDWLESFSGLFHYCLEGSRIWYFSFYVWFSDYPWYTMISQLTFPGLKSYLH